MLLTLPRELRDEIYTYILRPYPTPSYIEAISPPIPPSLHTNTNRTTLSQQRYKLCLSPHDPLQPFPRLHRRRKHTNTYTYPSLSILRVNRQTNAETRNMFWEHHTLYFRTLSETETKCHPAPGPVKFLKSIGQAASRNIISIRLNMGGDSPGYVTNYNTLPKVLTLLASRARYGAFKRLEIVWSYNEFLLLVQRDRRKMLEGLCVGNERPGYERIARVPELGREVAEEVQGVVREIHACFGGKTYVGEELVWDMERRVRIGVPIGAFGYLRAEDVEGAIGGVELW